MRRSSELLADMRRLERENQKNKKRGDALQKERDASRTELSKTVGLKEKLEKLCRELQRDNNKMKVRTDRFEQTITEPLAQYGALTLGHRMRIKSSRVRRSEITLPGTRNSQACYQSWRDTKRKKTPQRNKWWTWKWTNCKLYPLTIAGGARINRRDAKPDSEFDSNPSLSSTSCASCIFTLSCGPKNSKFSTTYPVMTRRRRTPKPKRIKRAICRTRLEHSPRRRRSLGTS